MASIKGDFIIPLAKTGTGMTERNLYVPSGKDVLSEILSVCQQGYGVRVVRACGAINACTLKQPGCGGSTVIAPYTGDFWIDILRGVFLPPIEECGGEIITNGLRVTLCHQTKRSWRKIQGIVSDRLTVAHDEVSVIVYVFKVDGERLKKRLDEVGKDAVLDEALRAPRPRRFSIGLRVPSTPNSGGSKV